MTKDDIINNIITKEGGYVNNPADRGGKTKYGITQKTWDGYAKGKPVPAAVAELTEQHAQAFYKDYMHRLGLDNLSGPILQFMFDFAAHSGYEAFRQVRRGLPLLLVHAGIESDPATGWRGGTKEKEPFSDGEAAFLMGLPADTAKLLLWCVKLGFWWRGVKQWYETHPKGTAAREWNGEGVAPEGVSRPGFHPMYLRGWINRSLDPLFWGDGLHATVPVLQAIVQAMARMSRREQSTWVTPLWGSFLRNFPYRDEVLKDVPIGE
jgi:hypothetical protein